MQGMALIRALREQGEVEPVLCAFSARPDETRLPTGLEAHVIPLGTSPLGKIRHRRALVSAIRSSRAEILHVHGYYRPAIRAALDIGMRVILKTTMYGVDDLATIAARSATDRSLLPRLSRVISLTPLLAASNRDWAKDVLIPNGIDLTRWSPPANPEAARLAARESLSLPAGGTVLLYTGGGRERKGVRILPDLWRAIRERLRGLEPHLVVAGDFPDPETVRWLESELGTENVTLLPHVISDLVPYLVASDALLFLSQREGLPNAVLEAAAMDTLVFALSIEGTYESILDEENSVVVDELGPEAVDRLGEALVRTGRGGIDNTSFREKFDIERIAERYSRLYREVLAR